MAEMKAVVVGAGMMGPGIAITLALGGIETRLSDLTSELAEGGISQAHRLLEELQANELIDPGAAASAKPRLRSLLTWRAAFDRPRSLSRPLRKTWA